MKPIPNGPFYTTEKILALNDPKLGLMSEIIWKVLANSEKSSE
jgi:hypothetical protein